MSKIEAFREHAFSYGHRVYGHEGKCFLAHGHNGRVIFYCKTDELDDVGRVIDFSVIKSLLCNWLEENWDHKFLLWDKDPWVTQIDQFCEASVFGLIIVPFNPTAENLANFLLNVVGPIQLQHTGVTLTKVVFYETSKCAAVAELK